MHSSWNNCSPKTPARQRTSVPLWLDVACLHLARHRVLCAGMYLTSSMRRIHHRSRKALGCTLQAQSEFKCALDAHTASNVWCTTGYILEALKYEALKEQYSCLDLCKDATRK